MNRFFPIFILLLPCLFFNCSRSKELPSKGLEQISEPLIKEFIDFLASDEMGGRPAPSEEADRAAEYIAMKLEEFGIKSVDGSYLQTVPFCAADLNIENCQFSLTKSGIDKEFTLKENFTPLLNTGSDRVKGELVFAGYGITAPE